MDYRDDILYTALPLCFSSASRQKTYEVSNLTAYGRISVTVYAPTKGFSRQAQRLYLTGSNVRLASTADFLYVKRPLTFLFIAFLMQKL